MLAKSTGIKPDYSKFIVFTVSISEAAVLESIIIIQRVSCMATRPPIHTQDYYLPMFSS